MDGLAQSEYVHRTVSGLQSVGQHDTLLAGVMCCALPSCAQGKAEPVPQEEGARGNIDTFLTDGPPFVHLGEFLPGHAWI